jgi:hypothetical protein
MKSDQINKPTPNLLSLKKKIKKIKKKDNKKTIVKKVNKNNKERI